MGVTEVRHSALLDKAVEALAHRGYWSAFPEMPSGKIYGETARADAEAAFKALLGQKFDLPGHPESMRLGAEVSPWGPELSIAYPAASVDALVAASRAAAAVWSTVDPARRIDLAAEMVVRLNRMSFLIANAVMHTTGQAFGMAFQAGGPHAQDRALEAIAAAKAEIDRVTGSANWEKPQGKADPIRMEKHWTIVPRGIGLVIGCNTFPTWNSYPALFASLATGNTVIVKPHPAAILPLALTVKVAREVLTEAGLPADVVLLAVDAPGREITKELASNKAIGIVDYTGSNAFGDWVRANAGHAQVFTEEAGVNSIVITGAPDFDAMCANIAFSLALYSGQMCTAPQNIYVPQGGIETNLGPRSFDEVGAGIAGAIDTLLADPNRGIEITGTIANPATLARVADVAKKGRVIRASTPLARPTSASPLLIATTADDPIVGHECFGPIAFLVAVKDAEAGIAAAAELAKSKGAITAALYAREDALIDKAVAAFAEAGVNLSINLTGNIFVNQSAAFSDFHVTGANPAGNACLTDTAFIVNRFRVAMWRRLLPPAA